MRQNFVVAADLAIKNDPNNATLVGETLAPGVQDLMANVSDEPLFAAEDARVPQLGGVAPNHTDNDELLIRTTRARREIKNLRGCVQGQCRLVKDLLHLPADIFWELSSLTPTEVKDR